MKLKTISEISTTTGHIALDIVGAMPMAEVADLTNALWYAKERDYISACLSLLSTIPAVGDVLGKGTKYLGKSSPTIQRILVQNGPTVAKYWPKIKTKITKINDWKPFIKELDNVISNVLQSKK